MAFRLSYVASKLKNHAEAVPPGVVDVEVENESIGTDQERRILEVSFVWASRDMRLTHAVVIARIAMGSALLSKCRFATALFVRELGRIVHDVTMINQEMAPPSPNIENIDSFSRTIAWNMQREV